MIITQNDDLLDVSEVNLFAKDFLERCNGKTSVESISRELYKHYGGDMKTEDFFDACVDAAQVLGKKGYLSRNSLSLPWKGGESLAKD